MNHLPHLAHQQLLDGNPNMGLIDQWVCNLPQVPDGRKQLISLAETKLWEQVWERRRKQLIPETLPTSPSLRQPTPHTETIALESVPIPPPSC